MLMIQPFSFKFLYFSGENWKEEKKNQYYRFPPRRRVCNEVAFQVPPLERTKPGGIVLDTTKRDLVDSRQNKIKRTFLSLTRPD